MDRNVELKQVAIELAERRRRFKALRKETTECTQQLAVEVKKQVGRYLDSLEKSLKEDPQFKELEAMLKECQAGLLLLLSQRYPQLSSLEIQLCLLIRAGLTTNQIVPLLRQSFGQVAWLRRKVRKELGVPSSVLLFNFLLSLEQGSKAC